MYGNGTKRGGNDPARSAKATKSDDVTITDIPADENKAKAVKFLGIDVDVYGW